jgi:nucleoside-diphosphate-sugar epimerase
VGPQNNFQGTIIGEGSLELLSNLLITESVTHLINLAASTNKSLDWNSAEDLVDANIQFSLDLALLAQVGNISEYIYISTYSTSINNEIYNPQTLYAATKKASEDILYFFSATNVFRLTIFNLYDVYGPMHPHNKIIAMMFDALMNGQRFRMSAGEQEICPIHIDDVVGALIATIEKSNSSQFRHFDLLGPDKIQLKSLPHILEESIGKLWQEGQLLRTLSTRDREIMTVSPKFGEPDFWSPKILRLIWLPDDFSSDNEETPFHWCLTW